MLSYTVPRSLPSGWTQPSNWIGYSIWTNGRTGIMIIAPGSLKFGDFIGFNIGEYPTTTSTTNYSVLFSIIK